MERKNRRRKDEKTQDSDSVGSSVLVGSVVFEHEPQAKQKGTFSLSQFGWIPANNTKDGVF